MGGGKVSTDTMRPGDANALHLRAHVFGDELPPQATCRFGVGLCTGSLMVRLASRAALQVRLLFFVWAAPPLPCCGGPLARPKGFWVLSCARHGNCSPSLRSRATCLTLPPRCGGSTVPLSGRCPGPPLPAAFPRSDRAR